MTIKATEFVLPVVLFIMPHNVVVTVKSVGEICIKNCGAVYVYP